jgi:hypothetical protein
MWNGVLRRFGLGLLVTLVLALFALNVLAWSGGLGLVDERSPPRQASEPALAEPADEPRNEPIARRRPVRPAERAKPPAPSGVSLVLTARRGDCWVEVRAGSATGETLYAGTLASGRSLRFTRPRIWLRLGAASNVDIEVNGQPSAIPSGTVELVLPDA